MRRVILLGIYFALTGVGVWLTYEWLNGAKGALYDLGMFISGFGLFLCWYELFSSSRAD